jgi:hypothetical protein
VSAPYECSHGPDERCFDCATDEEMAAAIPDYPDTEAPS